MAQGNIFSTRHNKDVVETRSLLAELGFQRPQRGSDQDYRNAVNALADQVLGGFGISRDQQRQLRQIDPSPDAMTNEIHPDIREKWTLAMLVLGTPEQFASARTIQDVCAQIEPQAQDILARHGLTTAAISDGLHQVARELQPA